MKDEAPKGGAITLRAHHLPNIREYVKEGVRLHWDKSTGYTDEFAQAHDSAVAAIVSDPQRRVRVVDTLDSICQCGVCPNLRPHCSSPDLAKADQRSAEIFGLQLNREYRAQEIVDAATRPVLDLKNVTLRTGEEMRIKLVTPPAGEYAEKLLHFLEHKPDWVRRNIKQQLSGMYDKDCVNKYFIGEIGGRIAGHVWYGYANRGAGIANFGEVYTEPEHRKKGVIAELMKVFKENFGNSPAKAALCTAGANWVTAIYFKAGFQAVIPGAERGPLILIKKGCGKDFEEFERAYYAPGREISIGLGSMKHRHDVDTLLRFSTILRRGRESGDPMKYAFVPGASLARRVGMAYSVTNYMDAVFKTEDGRGIVTVAAAKTGQVVGWTFFLHTGSEFEPEGKVFDFELHPSYAGSGPVLVRESLRLARARGITKAYSYCPAIEREKMELLRAEGFGEAARFHGDCRFGGETCDLVVLRHTST